MNAATTKQAARFTFTFVHIETADGEVADAVTIDEWDDELVADCREDGDVVEVRPATPAEITEYITSGALARKLESDDEMDRAYAAYGEN